MVRLCVVPTFFRIGSAVFLHDPPSVSEQGKCGLPTIIETFVRCATAREIAAIVLVVAVSAVDHGLYGWHALRVRRRADGVAPLACGAQIATCVRAGLIHPSPMGAIDAVDVGERAVRSGGAIAEADLRHAGRAVRNRSIAVVRVRLFICGVHRAPARPVGPLLVGH